jgi:hypothetical protein
MLLLVHPILAFVTQEIKKNIMPWNGWQAGLLHRCLPLWKKKESPLAGCSMKYEHEGFN